MESPREILRWKYKGLVGSLMFLMVSVVLLLSGNLTSLFGHSLRFYWVPTLALYLAYITGTASFIRLLNGNAVWGILKGGGLIAVISIVFCPILLLLLERLTGLPEYFSEGFFIQLSTYLTEVIPFLLTGAALLALTFQIVLLQMKVRRLIQSQEKDRGEFRKEHGRLLEGQIGSHFLFNAMNGITVAIRKGEKDRAADMVADLSDLLRSSMEEYPEGMTYEKELELLDRYLSLEHQRFRLSGFRESVEINFDDNLKKMPTIGFLLQPLVENAFKHGRNIEEELKISIIGRINNEQVEIEVHNTGSSYTAPTDSGVRRGVGLENLVKRLQSNYGSGARLVIENHKNSVSFRIVYPLKSQPKGK